MISFLYCFLRLLSINSLRAINCRIDQLGDTECNCCINGLGLEVQQLSISLMEQIGIHVFISLIKAYVKDERTGGRKETQKSYFNS